MIKADATIKTLSTIVEKEYYSELANLPVKNFEAPSPEIIAENLWLYKIDMLAYDKGDDDFSKKFEAVVSAVNLCGGTFTVMIDSGVNETSLFMGVYADESNSGIDTLRDVLRDSLRGNFQGIKIQDIGENLEATKNNIIEHFNNSYKNQCVTAISSIASASDDNIFSGIDTILNSVEGQVFTILVMAKPVNKKLERQTRDAYEKISTQISQLLNMSVGRQLSNTVSQNWQDTEGTSRAFQTGTSHSEGSGESEDTTDEDKSLVKYLLDAGAAFTALSGNLPVAYGIKMAGDILDVNNKQPRTSQSRNTQDSINESRTDSDLEADKPIIIAFDANDLINWLVAGQVGDDGKLRVIKSFFVKYDRKIEQLCEDFIDYYQYHRRHQVIFYYDSTFIKQDYGSSQNRNFAGIIKSCLRRHQWTVREKYIGNPMGHVEKNELINRMFQGRAHHQVLINRDNNPDLLISIQSAGVRNGKKDKSGEKLAETEEDRLEARTDGSDAFDTLCIGVENFPVGWGRGGQSIDYPT